MARRAIEVIHVGSSSRDLTWTICAGDSAGA